MLAGDYRVRLAKEWPDSTDADGGTDVLLALHARRSAASIAAWARTKPLQPLVVALTGTDLYRDIATNASAQQSLAWASRLIVLQEEGPKALPPELQGKCRVVFQSGTRRQALDKTTAHLRAVMVGHLRAEKSPQTLFAAARLIGPEEGILIDHIGAALDPALAEAALATQADCPHYRWLGGLPHRAARDRIQRAHVLVHPSQMEGGAHVVLEAVLSGTPVLASRIAGNVGMLGDRYEGFFPLGDAQALAAGLRTCRQRLGQPGDWLEHLRAQCALRAPCFDPLAEQSALRAVIAECLQQPAARP